MKQFYVAQIFDISLVLLNVLQGYSKSLQNCWQPFGKYFLIIFSAQSRLKHHFQSIQILFYFRWSKNQYKTQKLIILSTFSRCLRVADLVPKTLVDWVSSLPHVQQIDLVLGALFWSNLHIFRTSSRDGIAVNMILAVREIRYLFKRKTKRKENFISCNFWDIIEN